ncbi:pteridine reductase [Amphritea japonica]|uniref:Pteridine reductase n=1 Tax=Amphritea japonica ATCC BAA-1530 TaxID=1278309 RepID=A0A7R6SRK1_9GAMM|nr:pteridine reductase [Amphritea japonica]BBB25240.1 pteridine reductase [Amphritea japonica ATCC BAA-1530]
MNQPVALVTGAARRIGATIAHKLWQQGYRVIIHCNHSISDAEKLAQRLNNDRADSALVIQADLNHPPEISKLAEQALVYWGRVDLLINNASSFYPTPLQESTDQQWDDLINSNLKAAYFLSAQLAGSLKQQQGSIINLVDIHAQRALPGYPIYSIAKAGLQMMTISLAKELAPEVRVNGIAPGPILWPEQAASISPEEQTAIVNKTLLKRTGSPEDIAETLLFLARQNFITGQIIAVDGGKSLYSH